MIAMAIEVWFFLLMLTGDHQSTSVVGPFSSQTACEEYRGSFTMHWVIAYPCSSLEQRK